MLVKPSQIWSSSIKLGQTCYKLVLFGTGHYTHAFSNSHAFVSSEPKSSKNNNSTHFHSSVGLVLQDCKNLMEEIPCTVLAKATDSESDSEERDLYPKSILIKCNGNIFMLS